MASIVSENHLKALRLIISTLKQHGISYHITGGLAGNIYGSQWQLHDIDIEVGQKDIAKVEKLFQRFITMPLKRFIDEEFDLLMMTLRIHDVDIDINQAEDAWVFNNGVRVELKSDLSKANKIIFSDLEINVQPLADIIQYKELLGREKDLIELRAILNNLN